MKLILVFIPLTYGNGEPLPPSLLPSMRAQLVDLFGGMTVWPATGLWRALQQNATVQESVECWAILDGDTYNDGAWQAWGDWARRMLAQEELLIVTLEAGAILSPARQ